MDLTSDKIPRMEPDTEQIATSKMSLTDINISLK